MCCAWWRSIARGGTPSASSASSTCSRPRPLTWSFVLPDAQPLIVIRSIRLLRVFRIFKLAQFIGEGRQLVQALRASCRKITVFLGGVVIIVIIAAAVMYSVEGRRAASPASRPACTGRW